MQKIYQRATKVIVWLGPASKNSDLAFAFLTEASLNALDLDTWLPRNLRTKSRSKFWEAFGDIAGRDYWKRVWIIQEIVFASAVVVRCGFRCIRWPDFIFLFRSIATRPDLTDPSAGVLDVWANKLDDAQKVSLASDKLDGILSFPEIAEKSYGPAMIDNWKEAKNKADLPLDALLSSYRGSLSSDPRDKVFAIVGMTGSYNDKCALKIDYTFSLQETYIEAFRCVVERSKHLQGSYLNVILESLPHLSDGMLPSWVPDWRPRSNFDANTDTGPLSSIYRASVDSPLDSKIEIGKEVLVTEGVEIAVIDCLGAAPVPYPKMVNLSQTDAIVAVNNTVVAAVCEDTILAMSDSKQMPHSHKAKKIRRMEFCRTLLCNNGPITDSTVLGLTDEAIQEFWEVISSLNRDKLWLKLFMGTQATFNGQLLATLRWNLQRYRFCVSSIGSFVMAPPSACIGDVVCVLFGCDMPVLLRRRPDDRLVFVGACYADGIMDGEAIKDLVQEDNRATQFRIY